MKFICFVNNNCCYSGNVEDVIVFRFCNFFIDDFLICRLVNKKFFKY